MESRLFSAALNKFPANRYSVESKPVKNLIMSIRYNAGGDGINHANRNKGERKAKRSFAMGNGRGIEE
jgi:hypothetical protein